MTVWVALALLIAAAVVLFLTYDAGTVGGLQHDSFARLIALLALGIFIGGAVFASYRGRASQAVGHAVSWLALMLVLIALYSFRDELALVAERVLGELMPQGTQITLNSEGGGERAVRIRRGWGGHFVAKTKVQGRDIDMIVDTGASTVVLRHEDAQQIGIDVANLVYTVPVQTANGRSTAARIRLDTIAVGPLGMGNVDALVARPGTLHQSLLGMNFLSRLRSYEFSKDFLVLRG